MKYYFVVFSLVFIVDYLKADENAYAYENPNDNKQEVKYQISERLRFEMDGYLKAMKKQIGKNSKDLTQVLRRSNFYSIMTPLAYATDILLGIYARYDGVPSSDLEIKDFFRVAGLVIEDAAYDAEPLLSYKKIDLSCIDKFYPLIKKYNLDGKLNDCLNNNGYGKTTQIQQIMLDINDLKDEFSSTMGCVLSSKIASGKQKLSNQFSLYLKTANARLSLCK